MIAQACSVRFLLTSLGFLCCVVLPLSKVQAQEKKEAFYAQIIRGVVPLYHHIFVRNEGEEKERRTTNRDGTGFFVHTPDSLFVVTAAHVVGPNNNLHALVPLKPEGEQQTKVWKLHLPRSEWVFHPNKGTSTTREVDVAVMKIPFHEKGGAIAFMYCPKDCPQEQYNQLANDEIGPPEHVVIFGFPLDIGIRLKEPRPLGRGGIIALKTNEEFIRAEDGKYHESRTFLIEANMYPGNSGGPVIHAPLFGNLSLAGLITASNPSLTYAVVTPVSRIREVLDLAKDKALGKQG